MHVFYGTACSLTYLVCVNQNSPARGAAPVNNELEVGYDAAFESRWRHAELVSHICMALIVAAALAGLFGRGPLSHRTHQTEDGRLAVDFEPIARYGTSTQITLHLSPDVPSIGALSILEPGTAHVVLSSALIEPMGLQQVIPSPASSEAVGSGIGLVFNVPAGKKRAEVRLVIKPNDVGPIRLDVSQGSSRLSFNQFVLP
jgi:hypothetical protein